MDSELHEMAAELREVIASAEVAAQRKGGISVKDVTGDAIDESVEKDSVPLSKELAPVGETGRLQRGITSETIGWVGDEYHVRVGGTAPHTSVQEYGTRKKNYVIEAKDGGFLNFYWEAKGSWVRTRTVIHPGIEGKHFLRDGVLETHKDRTRRVTTALGEAFAGAYKGK